MADKNNEVYTLHLFQEAGLANSTSDRLLITNQCVLCLTHHTVM